MMNPKNSSPLTHSIAQPKTPSEVEDEQHDEESTFENQESMVHFVKGTIYGLPKEWVVEQRPRTSLKYHGKIDQFFYEPNTGRRFRSLKSAQKHIEMEAIENHEQTPADESSQLLDEHLKASPKKKKKKKFPSFDFENPPECVKWVLNDAEDDKWSPCIGNAVVPDDVKTHWVETFASIYYWN